MLALKIGLATEEEAKELEKFQKKQQLAEQERLEKKKARRTEINRKIGEEKRKKNEAGQMNLFDQD